MPNRLTVPATMAELLTDPQRVKDAFELLNALLSLQVSFVQPSGTSATGPGTTALKGDAGALVLPLPLKFTRSIADSTTTAADVSSKLNLLLAELRKTGQLPT